MLVERERVRFAGAAGADDRGGVEPYVLGGSPAASLACSLGDEISTSKSDDGSTHYSLVADFLIRVEKSLSTCQHVEQKSKSQANQ